MYIPRHFREDELAVLHTLMDDYSFALLVSVQADGLPVASHLPFVLEREPAPYGTLKAHFALGNAQWRTLQPEREVLVIFQGPHTYISPSWYQPGLHVPTWDYATVHAYARPRLLQQDELYASLRALVTKHEAQFPDPWPFDLPGEYVEKMMKGIVGVALEITRLESSFKMSQNRSEADRAGVSAALQASADPALCAVAELVRGVRKRS
jgi:transcriptional regulator